VPGLDIPDKNAGKYVRIKEMLLFLTSTDERVFSDQDR
jgi:hypothetical protein